MNDSIRLGRITCAVLLIHLLAACQTVPNWFAADKTFAGISPPQIHRKDDDGRNKIELGVKADDIKFVESKPFMDYYASLLRASQAADDDSKESQRIIADYISKGITVVNVSCLRWFNTLAESQTRFAYTQGNQNVIQNLGTTLLGVGKANPVITATYGALFTSMNGFETNYSQTFLLAPNANKVKEHIFTAMDNHATQLRRRKAPAEKADGTPSPVEAKDSKSVTTSSSTSKTSKNAPAEGPSLEELLVAPPTTFTEAYFALERYADICTPQTAKGIINSALDSTKSTVDSTQGNRVQTVAIKATQEANKLVQTSLGEAQKNLANTLESLQAKTANAASADEINALRRQLETIEATLKTPLVPAAPKEKAAEPLAPPITIKKDPT